MEEITKNSSNVKNGVTFGVIIGLIYCVSLFARYNMVSSGPIMIGLIGLIFYLIIIGVMVFCGIKRRKELGGYITFKDAFQTIFVAILIGELIYFVFNFIYLKYVDPNYYDKFYNAMEQFMQKNIKDETKLDEQLNNLKEQLDTQKTKGGTIKGIALSYLISVAVSGIIGMIVSLIIRKNPPIFNEPEEQIA